MMFDRVEASLSPSPSILNQRVARLMEVVVDIAQLLSHYSFFYRI